MNRRSVLIATVRAALPVASSATLPAALLALSASPNAAASEADADALVPRLRAGGVVLLLRHAATDPGVGDPPGFRAGDCGTQRNLSADGRAQAARLGAWARRHRLVPAAVRSSAWCRCLDTARLAFGSVTPWPALDSFFDEAVQRERRTAALAAALDALGPSRFEVWVTHQVNITALTGAFAAMGAGAVIEAADAASPAGARTVARFAL